MMILLRSRSRLQTLAAVLPFSLLLLASAEGAICGRGKYSGIVIFDRWDTCYLYGGVYLMEISEKVKKTLRPYKDQAITIDAQEVFQPNNPGDGLITKLKVLGPAPKAESFGEPPILDGLGLQMIPNFSGRGADELIIRLQNEGAERRAIDTGSLGTTLFSKKGLPCPFEPSDGSSYAALTRASISFLTSSVAETTCSANGKIRSAKLMLAPGTAISQRFNLDPGESVEIPLRFELSPGEYEALAGYGGGVFTARPLASNRFSFDVDLQGRAHLLPGSTIANAGRPPRRVGSVCGRVMFDDGRPAAAARISLWPHPIPERQPRAAASALSDADGWFHMDSVVEGKYGLSALSQAEDGVFAGAVGGRRLAEASTLELPVSESCPFFITVYRQPVYTIRGRTEPSNALSKPRTIRLIQTRGDALSFEASVEVQSDGRYEFRNVPAGDYQMFAGRTGAGFQVSGDIADLRVNVTWPAQ